MKEFFNETDRALLGSLVFNEDSEIIFAAYTDSIYWLDEYSNEIRWVLYNFRDYQSLFRHRARLYFNKYFDDSHLGEIDSYDEAVWEWTAVNIPSWIGFKRTHLKPEEVQAIRKMKSEGLE
ncbi:hypothetical protein HL666_20080 [Bradyrhizobium sp. 83002]|uniref:hypothetical protein n=1 Tax=Bradyrhizobium aeschynomenes TaxID=2734909 RepID=UPI001551F30E|nr:hypothetical protein [Bradyrhizobium aeschynomenes]NPU13072.1 hypothetical protein [Bradyrhizobium aeschynomenes]